MSSVQRLATVPGNGLPPRRLDWFDARRAGGPSRAEAWDPVTELVHDLRSPLTSILTLSEALMRGASGEVSDLQRRQLAIVYGAALGLTALLTDVIDLADGGADLLEREPAPFCIGEVFESVAHIVRPLAASKGLAVRTRSPARDRRVGHASALRRVLLNLTTNAVKFTDEGHVEMVATPGRDGRLSISVRDSGRGLPPAVTETLAQPVGPSPAGDGHPFGATSLGLAICRKLLRSMGSELEFETWPGRGTRFHFALDVPSARVP